MFMELIGKIYQMWGSDVKEEVRYFGLQKFKGALGERGFEWTESFGSLDIHDGRHNDNEPNNCHKVGELRNNKIFVIYSPRLEDFLENYDN